VITANDGTAQAMVFTPDGDDEGTVALMPIMIEPTPRGEVLVIEGLSEGQEIVASGANLLSDGARIKRFAGFSN